MVRPINHRIQDKVSELVEKCPLEMGGLSTCKNLNIFPLGSDDILIGMDWLEAQKIKLDHCNKILNALIMKETQGL